jgi:hypothetical protein
LKRKEKWRVKDEEAEVENKVKKKKQEEKVKKWPFVLSCCDFIYILLHHVGFVIAQTRSLSLFVKI